MITLITGLPASGKTIRLKHIADQCTLTNQPYFFNDDKYLTFQDLEIIKALPSSSFVLIDDLESSSILNSSELLDYLATHRHLGHQIYICSQLNRLLPKTILSFVSRTVDLSSSF